MRSKVELMHQISVLYNWATTPDRDTISGLSDKQASQACEKLRELWTIVERRSSGRKGG